MSENQSDKATAFGRESDVSSRIASIDQSLRSLDMRLRAVETRISMQDPEFKPERLEEIAEETTPVGGGMSDKELGELKQAVEGLQSDASDISQRIFALENVVSSSLTAQVDSIGSRLDDMVHDLAGVSRKLNEVESSPSKGFSVGSLHIPIDLTGLIAACLLFAAAFLAATDNFDLVKSPIMLGAIGVIFIAGVVAKTYMANREEPDT